MKDSEFVNYFMVILGVLVLIAVFILVLANVLASKQETMDLAMLERTKERIAPIGQVNVGTVPDHAVAVPSVGSQADTTEFEPSGVYQSVCHACHGTGVLEAPRVDDKAEWEKRLADGVDNVYRIAIQGRGNMPPKGGRADLSDEHFERVVDYMLKQAGITL